MKIFKFWELYHLPCLLVYIFIDNYVLVNTIY